MRISGLDPNKTYTYTSYNEDPFATAGQVVYSNIDPQQYAYRDLVSDTGFYGLPPQPLTTA